MNFHAGYNLPLTTVCLVFPVCNQSYFTLALCKLIVFTLRCSSNLMNETDAPIVIHRVREKMAP